MEDIKREENLLSAKVVEPDKDVRFAGFWIRFFAYIMDLVLIKILFVFLLMFFSETDLVINLQPLIVGFICAAFYTSSWQATPGGKALGIKVVNKKDYGKLSYGKALARYFVPLVVITLITGLFGFLFVFLMMGGNIAESYIAVIFAGLVVFVWFITIAFTKEKTAVHDMMLKTRVIYNK